ncbi:restriction endonuclease subunit S [Aeromonas veronii]
MAEQMMQEVAGKTIPAGYKQTEVGVIPEDWGCLDLSELFSFKQGIQVPVEKQSKTRLDGFVRFIRIIDLTNPNEPPRYIKNIRKTECLTSNDLFMVRYGAPGLVGFNKEGLIANNLFRLLPRVDLHESFYFYYLGFRHADILDVSGSSTMPAINFSTISKFKIVKPSSIKEQTAIANVLSDSDALIGALEQLIAKKQAIKSAAMQQLLTGRTRLPAFALRPDGTPKGYKPSELGEIPEDWGSATIHDITDNIIDYRGRTPKKLGMEWGGGNIPALSAGNVKKGFIDYQAECYFGSDELYRKWMMSGPVQKDDIVFTMEAPLGNAALIPDDQRYILSQRTVLLQIARAKYNPKFIIHYFLSDSFQRYISDSATGSTAQGIKRTTFEKMYVAVPICIEEQTTIATILSDMDNELQALTQKLEKARALKQGMMQQLLTGKIRLPLEVQA